MAQTFYAWTALGVRSFGMLMLLILASNSYKAEEIAIWLVLQVIVSLLAIFDFGVSPTIMRFSIYAFHKDRNLAEELNTEERDRIHRLRQISIPNLQTYARNLYVWMSVFGCIASISLSLFAIGADMEGQHNILWLIAISSIGNMFGILQLNYSTYLNARKKVTVLKKAEAILGLIVLIFPFFMVIYGFEIVFVFVAITVGKVLTLLVLRKLAFSEGYISYNSTALPLDYLKIVFPQTYRTGISIAASAGVLQLSALILARTIDATEAATYLLGIRLLSSISQFSNVPFYTRLPYLISRFVSGERSKLYFEAKNLISLSIFLNSFGAVIVYILVDMTGAKGYHSLDMMPKEMWVILLSTIAFERLSAMYSQIRSLNNRIDWHLLNVPAGLMTLFLLVVLLPMFDAIGYVIALAAPVFLFLLPVSTFRLLAVFPKSINMVGFTMAFSVGVISFVGLFLYYFYASSSLAY